ncbi:MAG TPA: efflux RND transporter periplasmic adaptor subunit [Nitrospira sp.]|nr:efflux RND transporter periplasmic adaptor subunit [Nitrospira sp.]
MTTDPQDSTRPVPVTDIVPAHPTQPPAHHASGNDHALTIPAETGYRFRRKTGWGWLVVLAGVLLLIGAGAWYWWNSGPPPVRYKTALVDRGPITAIVTATGTVNPVVSVQVGSQVSGKIAKLFADFNSVVTQGQVLAQIDQQPYKARVSQAHAAAKSAKGNLDKAKNMAAQRKRERDRMATLRKQAFVSQADLDLAETNYRDAEAQVEVSQAQLDQAEATLASAELDLGYTTIYSPVNGIVVSRNVDVGQTVVASFQTPTLFVIAQDLTQMQVDSNVSESDIGGVAEGKAATFRVDAYPKQFFEGTVTQVRNAPINIQNVITYDVVITVDNRELKLKPGMTANVTIVTAKKDDPLRVPNGALRFRMPNVPVDRKISQVWLLAPEAALRQATITTGIADSLFTEVVEGPVKEGDKVIIGIETAEEQTQKTLPPGFGGGPRMR